MVMRRSRGTCYLRCMNDGLISYVQVLYAPVLMMIVTIFLVSLHNGSPVRGDGKRRTSTIWDLVIYGSR